MRLHLAISWVGAVDPVDTPAFSEKRIQRYPKLSRRDPESTCRYAIDPSFIFLKLLEAHAHGLCERSLQHAVLLTDKQKVVPDQTVEFGYARHTAIESDIDEFRRVTTLFAFRQ